MGKDAVKTAEHVNQVLNGSVLVVGVGKDEATGKDLGVCDDVGGPVEGVAAVVDGAAGARLLVDSAQELPLGGPHLWAGGGAAGRRVKEEADDQAVALSDKEAAELVEPEGAVGAGGGLGEDVGGLAGDGDGVVGGVVVVKGGEVFLQLESRVELGVKLATVNDKAFMKS